MSILGHLYIECLKRIEPVRLGVAAAWRFCHPIYAQASTSLSSKEDKTRDLVDAAGITSAQVCDEELSKQSYEDRLFVITAPPPARLNIRIVNSKPGSVEAVDSIKGSSIGQLYIKYLKQIEPVRFAVVKSWQISYPIFAQASARLMGRADKQRPLVKMANYTNTSGLTSVLVYDIEKINTPHPSVIPSECQIYLDSPHDHYIFPPLTVEQISNATVDGRTNLVLAKGCLVHHDLYNFVDDYTSEELHGRHVIDTLKLSIRRLQIDKTPERIPVAATFLDACAGNYAHWLTEVLPRISVFCSLPECEHIPIIIDGGLHPNIMESLSWVVGEKREVICLPLGRSAKVDKLYNVSPTGYVPFEGRQESRSLKCHGLFSPFALKCLRDKLLKPIIIDQIASMPKKIYLKRTSGGRRIVNGKEVEDVLLRRGYTIIEANKLSFSQQVALFNGADSIIGPSGAALANIIFARSDAKIHVLIGEYEGTRYWYWQNMACASGKKITYSFGRLLDRLPSIHSDFMIDTNVLGHEN